MLSFPKTCNKCEGAWSINHECEPARLQLMQTRMLLNTAAQRLEDVRGQDQRTIDEIDQALRLVINSIELIWPFKNGHR